MATEKNKLTVDDFLAQQSENQFLATIEPLENQPDLVKVTPWLVSGKCLCHNALNIPKNSIESLQLTNHQHVCCGKVLKVVSVQFKDGASVSIDQLFEQFSQQQGSAERMDLANFYSASPSQINPRDLPLQYFNQRTATTLGQKDPECVADCLKTAAGCAAACKFAGISSPLGMAICLGGCVAFGQACSSRCYPLFPDEVFPNSYLHF